MNCVTFPWNYFKCTFKFNIPNDYYECVWIQCSWYDSALLCLAFTLTECGLNQSYMILFFSLVCFHRRMNTVSCFMRCFVLYKWRGTTINHNTICQICIRMSLNRWEIVLASQTMHTPNVCARDVDDVFITICCRLTHNWLLSGCDCMCNILNKHAHSKCTRSKQQQKKNTTNYTNLNLNDDDDERQQQK